MKTPVRTAVESSLVAAVAAAGCLWLLVSAANAEDANAANIVLGGVGLAISLIAHWTYLCLALQRAGRAVLPWAIGMVLLCPVASVVALVLLNAEDEAPGA